MGAEDLVLNGHDVAVVEYHITDIFETPYALARQNFYWVTALPTVYFDGVIENSGGNGGTSLYEEYLPLYEQRKEILSDFTIDVEGVNSQLTDYVVNVSVEKVVENNSSNMKLFFVLTETEIEWVWMGQPTVNYCQRISLPDENGSSLNFPESDILNFSFPFTVDLEWHLEHCEIVVWIQNMSNKEVYQTAKRHISEFGDFPERDISAKHLYTPVTLCNSSFVPELEVENLGSVDLTSLDLVYQIDDEPAQTYSWNGNIPALGSGIIPIPEINTWVFNSSTFRVYTENPNGQADEFIYNDTISNVITEADGVSSPITVVIKLDNNPEQTSWAVINSGGDVLYNGGDYNEPNTFITESLDFSESDCYSFVIYDDGGDGLTGTGIYKLMSGTTIFQTGKEFGHYDEVQFGIGIVNVDENISANPIVVYPNPATGKVNIETTIKTEKIQLLNFAGQIILEQITHGNKTEINTSEFDSGIYYIKVYSHDNVTTRKLVIE